MKKQDFLRQLNNKLETLPKAEKDKITEYYNELFEDQIESGKSESDIVSSWGDVGDIALQFLQEAMSESKATKPQGQANNSAPNINVNVAVNGVSVSEKNTTKTNTSDTPIFDALLAREAGTYQNNKVGGVSPDAPAGSSNQQTYAAKLLEEIDKNEQKTHKNNEKTAKKSNNILKNKTFWIVYFSAFIITFPLTAALFGVAVGIAAALFSIIITLLVTPVAMALGGIWTIVAGFVHMATDTGVGFAMVGLGALLLAASIMLYFLLRFVIITLTRVFKTRKANKTNTNISINIDENKNVTTTVNRTNGRKRRPVFVPWLVGLCVFLFVVGIVSHIGGMSQINWAYANLNTNTFEATTFSEITADINEININVLTKDVVITFVDEDFRVEYFALGNSSYNVNFENNVLTFTQTLEFRFFNTFNWTTREHRTLTLFIPQHAYNNVNIRTTSGRINLNNLEVSNNLTLNVTSGNITLNNIEVGNNANINTTSGNISMTNLQANRLESRVTSGRITANYLTLANAELRTTSGNVTANNISVSGNINLRTTSGNVTTNNVVAGGNVDINLTSGRTNINTMQANSIRINAVSGSVTAEGVDSTNFYVRLTSGRISAKFTNPQSEYNILVGTRSGRSNINSQTSTYAHPRNIEARTTSGNISLSFA